MFLNSEWSWPVRGHGAEEIGKSRKNLGVTLIQPLSQAEPGAPA